MNRLTQHLLLVLLGGVTLRVALGQGYLAYVQAGFRPLLVAAGAAVLAVGVLGVLRGRPGTTEHPGPRVAWLLVAPVAVLLVVAPGPLGAFTAQRQAAPVSAPATEVPLGIGADDPGADHRTMTLSGYAIRTQQTDTSPLEGRTIRLVGFLSPREGGGWYLARIRIACCAADATAVQVVLDGDVHGTADQWVEVVGRYAPSSPHPGLGYPEPTLTPDTVTPVPAPADGYED
ncbi:TIGR03943 family protein [Klenkia soli]|uniref:TIGR03943 family protein n=1 Tax=Klenkia soli TaxID=1052260 RepID=A0A1H0RW07_9ACTN|nr:TIGR03943 family protein [Klenkia soli]SDP33186.1 TIGR03943 family protein [Klenkia soli]